MNPFHRGLPQDVNHLDYNHQHDPTSLIFGNEVNANDQDAVWLCKVGIPSFPMKLNPHMGEQVVMDSVFMIPVDGEIYTNIYIPEEFLLKVYASGPNGVMEMEVSRTNSGFGNLCLLVVGSLYSFFWGVWHNLL